MTPERANEIISTASDAYLALAIEASIMRAALEKIEKYREPFSEGEARRVAFDALTEIDARRAIAKHGRAASGDPSHVSTPQTVA